MYFTFIQFGIWLPYICIQYLQQHEINKHKTNIYVQFDRHREAMTKQIEMCTFHCTKNADNWYKTYILIRSMLIWRIYSGTLLACFKINVKRKLTKCICIFSRISQYILLALLFQ